MPTPTVNISSLIDLALPQDPPENFKDKEVRGLYTVVLTAINNFLRYVEQYCGITPKDITQWSSLTPSDTILTYNLRRLYVKAAVDLSYGNFVNLYDAGTDLQARKSDSTAGIKAHGYVNTGAGILTGEYGEVILFCGLVNISGIVRGTSYFMATNGQVAAAAGLTKQFVGFGVATDLLCVEIDKSPF